MLIYDSIDKTMLHGYGFNAYSDSYWDMFTNLSLSTKHTNFENFEDFVQGGFDVIEKGIIQSLLTPGPVFWGKRYQKKVGSSSVYG